MCASAAICREESCKTQRVIRILLIRAWPESAAPIRAALHAHGLSTRITRVDFEPALVTAIERGDLDVVLFDPAVKTISLAGVEACMAQHHRTQPIVQLGEIAQLASSIEIALARLRN